MNSEQLTELMAGKRLRLTEARIKLYELVDGVGDNPTVLEDRAGRPVAAIVEIGALRSALQKAEAYDLLALSDEAEAGPHLDEEALRTYFAEADAARDQAGEQRRAA